MNIARKKKAWLILIAVLACLLLAVLCFKFILPQKVFISGSLVERSLEDLFSESALVVRGTVSEPSESLKIRSTRGSDAIYTDYKFDVSELLRGNDSDDELTIRVQGGTIRNVTEVYEHSPVLSGENEYLLFLYKPARGGAYNTDGDYYYILGLTQGTFVKDEDGDFISGTGVVLPADDIAQYVNNAGPVNVNYFREEYIANQKRNLETGFITQEEYNKLMDEIDEYAAIVK